MTSDPDKKLCKDCRWYKEGYYNPGERSKCKNPEVAGRSPVTGEVITLYCDIERGRHYPVAKCGPKGRAFQPKHIPAVPPKALQDQPRPVPPLPEPVPWWAWVLRGL